MTWWQQAASMDEVRNSTSSIRLISSPHLTNNTHTSTNTHTHVDTSLIHHGSSIYRDWPSSNTHNKRGWGVKFIFYYSSISLNTHHQHATTKTYVSTHHTYMTTAACKMSDTLIQHTQQHRWHIFSTCCSNTIICCCLMLQPMLLIQTSTHT